ncbi:hypothetical protein LINPERPRIM_LOCUS1314 [Linum perenne]
MNRRYRRT